MENTQVLTAEPSQGGPGSSPDFSREAKKRANTRRRSDTEPPLPPPSLRCVVLSYLHPSARSFSFSLTSNPPHPTPPPSWAQVYFGKRHTHSSNSPAALWRLKKRKKKKKMLTKPHSWLAGFCSAPFFFQPPSCAAARGYFRFALLGRMFPPTLPHIS